MFGRFRGLEKPEAERGMAVVDKARFPKKVFRFMFERKSKMKPAIDFNIILPYIISFLGHRTVSDEAFAIPKHSAPPGPVESKRFTQVPKETIQMWVSTESLKVLDLEL